MSCMQPNSQRLVDVPSEIDGQWIFDRPLRGGASGVCSRDVRQPLALASAKHTRKVLETFVTSQSISASVFGHERDSRRRLLTKIKCSPEFSILESQ